MCIYNYIYIYMFIYIYVHIYICIHMKQRNQMIIKWAKQLAKTHVIIIWFIRNLTLSHVWTFIYIYMKIYSYIYIYWYIHIYIYVCSLLAIPYCLLGLICRSLELLAVAAPDKIALWLLLQSFFHSRRGLGWHQNRQTPPNHIIQCYSTKYAQPKGNSI